MPARTLLRWHALSDPQPLGDLDLTWRWEVLVGSSHRCDVVLSHPTVEDRAARFVRIRNQWWIEDLLHTTNGIWIGTQRVTWERVGDRPVVIAAGGRFTLEHTPMPPEEVRLQEAILAAPDEDAGLLVYADWLQERDDELGRQMAAPKPSHQRWLGPMVAFGTEVVWRRGFIDEATVRSSANNEGPTRVVDQGVFAEVLVHPLAVFLRCLRADVSALETETHFGVQRWVQLLFEALVAARPRALQRLEVSVPAALPPQLEAQFEEVRRAIPSLRTTWATLAR